MKQNTFKHTLVGVILGGLLVWLITLTTVNSQNQGMMQMMGFGRISQQGVNNSNVIDAHFIEQMIPHHQDAIIMSELALTKAIKPEVKQLSQNIINSQGKEIDQMKAWYQDWFGKELPVGSEVMGQHGMMSNAGMHMGMMGNETDITKLENAEDFDRAFVEHMIPHHQMAVMMAGMLKNGTGRTEMKKLAEDIITSQTKEINQMRQWLIDWEN